MRHLQTRVQPSAPGSYYLTGNLTANSSSAGITIAADNVTLDLNGFELVGGGSGTVSGINVPSAQKNISVRNGIVRGWTNGGVHGDKASNSLFENLRVSDNSGTSGGGAPGLTIGSGSLARECAAQGNTNISGLHAQAGGCYFVGNTLDQNLSRIEILNDHNRIEGNSCTFNTFNNNGGILGWGFVCQRHAQSGVSQLGEREWCW